MRIGSVVAPGPVVKLAMTRSSSDSANASIQAAAMAGRISGKVTDRKVRSGERAEIHRRFFETHVEVDEPRLHDHGDEAHRHGGMGNGDRPKTAVHRDGDKQQQQRQAR